MTEMETMPATKRENFKNVHSFLTSDEFNNRWLNGNFKTHHKFTEHDNNNLLQNHGEYFDKGLGKRHSDRKLHKSTALLPPIKASENMPKKSKENDSTSLLLTIENVNKYTNYFHRYPRRHLTKINNAPIEHQHNVNAYLEQAQKMRPSNSLNFETDMFVKPKTSRHRKSPTDPYRHTLLHPWKHAYFSYQYPECKEEYKRVRSTTEWFDLSKY